MRGKGPAWLVGMTGLSIFLAFNTHAGQHLPTVAGWIAFAAMIAWTALLEWL